MKKAPYILTALALMVSLAVPVSAAAPSTESPQITVTQVTDPMRWAVERGLMSDAAGGDTVTHALVAGALYRMSGSPAVTGCHFSDVRIGDDGWNAARWAVDHSVFFMYDNGAFAPDNTLSRDGLIRAMQRYARAVGLDDPNNSYRVGVSWALETGVLVPDADGTIRTDVPATGRDLAQALYGLHSYYGGGGEGK